jgi:beta-glucosidase
MKGIGVALVALGALLSGGAFAQPGAKTPAAQVPPATRTQAPPAVTTPAAQKPKPAAAASLAPPWMNTALTPDQRADLIHAQMTRDEELTLVHGYLGIYVPNRTYRMQPEAMRGDLPNSAGYVPGIPRLGIPALNESDASLGVANGGHMRPGDTATALPSSALTAATWNADLAYLTGAMIAQEARAKGFNVLLAGGNNLVRDPRGGRTFEYVGEDPLLAGVMAGESIRGIQDQHIISTTKHYALNDQETLRTLIDARIDEGAARESDLLAFEIAIEHGDPGAVMCAYNRVNGVYACENDWLLNKVLKTDWGYHGFVLSDWGAVHSTVDAANNGLDQESSNSSDAQDYFGDALKDAVANGRVDEARLHDMVQRILRSMFAKGLFDAPPVKAPINVAADTLVAQRDAEEGIVLLRNERGILPLRAGTQRIVVIDGEADIGTLSGAGSSQVIPNGSDGTNEVLIGRTAWVDRKKPQASMDRVVYDPPSPLSALRAEAPAAQIQFDRGEDIEQAAAIARGADVVIVFVQQWMREGADASDLSLHGDQNALIDALVSCNPNTIVVLETGGPVLMPWLSKSAAVVEAWYGGSGGAAALAHVLFGKVNPSGRLPITFPQDGDQLPRHTLAGIPQPGITSAPPGPPVMEFPEGSNVGYRWFEQEKLVPLFPFGFGLSYSTFTFTGLSVKGGSTLIAEFDVRNTSTVAGKAVAELYATPPQPDAVARLVGWSKVDLKPGETRHLTVTADPRLVAQFDTDAHAWRVAGGDYPVGLGVSSADIRASATAHLDAATIRP